MSEAKRKTEAFNRFERCEALLREVQAYFHHRCPCCDEGYEEFDCTCFDIDIKDLIARIDEVLS